MLPREGWAQPDRAADSSPSRTPEPSDRTAVLPSERQTLYLASALGFNDAGDAFREELHALLAALDVDVLDPWDAEVTGPLTSAGALAVGHRNFVAIRSATRVLAVLDGSDIDSGVACELGFAHAIGLRCDGLRTDIRLAGECGELGVNLQVASAIHESGGAIVRRLEDLPALFQRDSLVDVRDQEAA